MQREPSSTTTTSTAGTATRSPGEGEDAWLTDDARALARAFLALRTEGEALRFLRDVCTVNELLELGHRWRVARLLDEGVHYAEIGERTGASSATISRVNQWLRYGRGGYRLVIDRLKRGEGGGAGGEGQQR